MTAKSPFVVTRAYRNDAVKIGVSLRASAWNGPTIRMEASECISPAAARALAAALIAEADRVDAAEAKKAAAKARRAAWRERQIAAGRMKAMTAEEFFRR